MADDDKTTVPSEGSEKGKQTKEPALSKEEQKEWKKITGDKFKSEDDLAKSYKELEERLGKQGDELNQAREFAQVVQPLLETIRDDPELFKTLDNKLRSKGQPSDTSTNSDTSGKKTSQGEREAISDIILAGFEEKHGITALDPSEQKEVRNKMGSIIYEMTGQTISTLDLRRLNSVLDNAFILANKDKLLEKSKLEALISAKNNNEAGIPSISSSPGKSEEGLSPEEVRVAERMGLTREQYLEGKKKVSRQEASSN